MAVEQLQEFTNNATTTVPSTISNVATSITVATGTGSLFPTLTGSEFFIATLVNTIALDPGFGQMEIIKVTARSGDVMTVVRGQEGTSGTNFPTGVLFELRPTAQAFNNIYTEILELETTKAPLDSPVFTGNPTAPTPTLGDADTSIATTGFVTTALNTYSPGRTNILMNPHGSIQQETTTAVTVTNNYLADQWVMQFTAATAALQAGVTTGSVSFYDPSYMFIKTTTAKAVLAAGDFSIIAQPVEGSYIRRLLNGGSTAKGSWLRWTASSSQAGTASVSVRNGGANRSFVHEFAVSTTPTEYSVFVPGDTTGTWPITTAIGAQVSFCHAAGTTFQTATLGAWQAGNFIASTNQSNMLDTVNRQLNVTDVHWAQSAILLPFEVIDFEEELSKCQRYWEATYDLTIPPGTVTVNGAVWWSWLSNNRPIQFHYMKNTKRVAPTVTVYNPVTGAAASIRDVDAGADRTATVQITNMQNFSFYAATAAGTLGNSLTAHWVANARM